MNIFPEKTFLLSTKNNPYSKRRANGFSFWGYPERQGGLGAIRVIGVHTTQNDLWTPALNVAKWQAYTAASPSSYHCLIDPDTILVTLSDQAVAFHIVGLNTAALGLSFTTKAHVWGQNPSADRAMLERAAQKARQWMNRYNIPLRWLSRAEARDGRSKGFVRHSTADPDRRSDPGRNFPAQLWFQIIADDEPGNRVLYFDKPMMRGSDVREWQEELNKWHRKIGRDTITEDGVFGEETRDASSFFMAAWMGVSTDSPRVGPVTREAMEAALEAPIEEEEIMGMTPEDRAMLSEVHSMLKNGNIGGRKNIGDDTRRLRLDMRAIGRVEGLTIAKDEEEGFEPEEGTDIVS